MVTLPRYTPQNGDWYYGGICPTCGIRVPFTLDPEDGAGPFELPPGWIEMTCDHGHQHRYRAGELNRFQHKGQKLE